MKIGDKIRSLRLIRGFSQENLADLLGMSSIGYGDIERNKTDVSYSRLEQIAKALGKSLVELLAHGEHVASIFSDYSNNQIISGTGNTVYTENELKHELQKAQLREVNLQLELKNSQLENDNLRLKLEKVGIELKNLKATVE